MSSRRHHTKSRHGCSNCKRRKVKCDETHPSCNNCIRHGVPCSFIDNQKHGRSLSPFEYPIPVDPRLKVPFPGPEYFTPESIHEPPPIPPCTPTSIPASSGDLWTLSGLELMHHYTTETAPSLGFQSGTVHVWRCIMPQIGYDHPFVMHGLLSIAALHKAELFSASAAQRERYINLAAYHQGLGMEPFRAGLAHVNDVNWKSLLCFSSCILLYVCLRPSQTAMGSEEDAVNILEVFNFARGHRAILESYQSRIQNTIFAPVVHGIWRSCEENDIALQSASEDSRIPSDVFEALQRLSDFLQDNVPSEIRGEYAESIVWLERIGRFMLCDGPDYEFGMLFMFAYIIPEAVLADIQVLSPNALALLAYFSVFWSIMEPSYWFLKSWSHGLFHVIDLQLAGNDKVMEIIEWPREQVKRLADSRQARFR